MLVTELDSDIAIAYNLENYSENADIFSPSDRQWNFARGMSNASIAALAKVHTLPVLLLNLNGSHERLGRMQRELARAKVHNWQRVPAIYGDQITRMMRGGPKRRSGHSELSMAPTRLIFCWGAPRGLSTVLVSHSRGMSSRYMTGASRACASKGWQQKRQRRRPRRRERASGAAERGLGSERIRFRVSPCAGASGVRVSQRYSPDEGVGP